MEHLFTWLSDGVKWLALGLVSMVTWTYRNDRRAVDNALKAKDDAIKEHAKQIAVLDATRPTRSEMQAGMIAIKDEIGRDINVLRVEVNARLDTLIKIAADRAAEK